jgi:hypothetical protein
VFAVSRLRLKLPWFSNFGSNTKMEREDSEMGKARVGGDTLGLGNNRFPTSCTYETNIASQI